VPDGTFGLDREQAIGNTKVRQVFTPFAPIDLVDHFCGREPEIAQLVAVVNSPGQHVLLYGDRGVGKTSLATIACRLIFDAKVSRGQWFTKRCGSEDSFASVVRVPLRAVGIDYELSERTQSVEEGGSGKVKILVAEGAIKTQRSMSTKTVPRNEPDSPSWVAEHLTQLKGLFLIDEVDALHRKGDRQKIAELIKLLSDARSDFKIMVVGIAKTGEDLTAGHPSVERCLKETHLSRMADRDLRKIADQGMEKLRLLPSEGVVDRIVGISAGYPHFAHLICLKCAENAIVAGRRRIDLDDLADALVDAVAESEGALRRRYENTIRGVKHEAEYVSIMRAATECPVPEFRLSNLHRRLEERLGASIPMAQLSRYMTSMLATRDRGVFVRVSKGVYMWSDPRMPSFVKMVGLQAGADALVPTVSLPSGLARKPRSEDGSRTPSRAPEITRTSEAEQWDKARRERSAQVRNGEPRERLALKVGDAVAHPTFGRGIVRKALGDRITIDFGGPVGSKTLLNGFAPLTRIE